MREKKRKLNLVENGKRQILSMAKQAVETKETWCEAISLQFLKIKKRNRIKNKTFYFWKKVQRVKDIFSHISV